MNQRVISAQIPVDLLDQLHDRAHADDRSSAAVIRQALRQYLAADAPFERRWGSRALAGQGTEAG